MQDTAERIANYLRGMRRVAPDSVKASVIKIGRTSYPCAFYRDADTKEDRCYVLGDLPACYLRTRRVCFRFPDSSDDWYIAGWATPKTVASGYAALGIYWLLFKWDVPTGESIDHFDDRPAPRKRIEVRQDES